MWSLLGFVFVVVIRADAAAIEASENAVHPLPEKVYTHLYSFMSKSQAFKDFSLEDCKNWIDKQDQFKPPADLVKNFPYYQSGFDKENRPVWVGEIGRFNIRKEVEKGPKAMEDLEKYLYQAAVNIGKSMLLKDNPEKPVHSVFFIADWDESNLAELAHLPTINLGLRLLRKYIDIFVAAWGYCVSINVNPAAERYLDLLRPIAPGILDKMEVVGTNKEKWTVALKNHLPESAIPNWYGGNKDFKPVAVHG